MVWVGPVLDHSCVMPKYYSHMVVVHRALSYAVLRLWNDLVPEMGFLWDSGAIRIMTSYPDGFRSHEF